MRIRFYHFYWVDTSAGEKLVTDCVSRPVVSISSMPWFIWYLWLKFSIPGQSNSSTSSLSLIWLFSLCPLACFLPKSFHYLVFQIFLIWTDKDYFRNVSCALNYDIYVFILGNRKLFLMAYILYYFWRIGPTYSRFIPSVSPVSSCCIEPQGNIVNVHNYYCFIS